jgi:aminoglycoside phosphotransferase (APT) family kinase protein
MPDLDIERPDDLLAYLRATGRVAPDESPRVQTLAGGVSNRTVLVERADGPSFVLKQALAKLRVAVDWFSDPARIEREALGLKHLAELAPPGTITPLTFEDPANHLLAMAAVPKPHDNWKSVLLAGQINPDHVIQFAKLLATIHRRAAENRAELATLFADRRFFESLRLEPYYQYTSQQLPESRTFYKELVIDTRLRQLTLVHGDYSPKNVLVHDRRLILLDHEVIHWGDPAFDVGFALTHFLSKGHHLPAHRPALLRTAKLFWQTYRQELGHPRWATDLEDFAVRHTLGIMLARVAGRSPLEYLTPAQRDWQRHAVLAMMADPPTTVDDLTDTFLLRE